MQGKCDICGEPATAKCEATGCTQEMCEQHTTRKFMPALDINNTPRIPTFCPRHADLARS